VPFRALHPLARARARRTMADRSGADRYAFDVLTALALRMDEDGRAEVGPVRLAWLARAGLLIRRRSGPRGLYRDPLACPTPDVLDAPTAARFQTGTDDAPTRVWGAEAAWDACRRAGRAWALTAPALEAFTWGPTRARGQHRPLAHLPGSWSARWVWWGR
jgi:hypothetical protein